MMRCSNCSKEVKPVVAIDIDGTIGDYHRHFREFCAAYWDKPHLFHLPPWTGAMPEFEDYLGLTKQQYREAKLAYRQGGNKRWLPIYPEAKVIVDGLREAGAEVWIATTRPWQRLDNIDPDTREWLRRNSLRVDGLLYGDDKYRQLCLAVDHARIAAVIEDLPEQVKLARNMGIPTILRENFHNCQASEKFVPRGSLAICGAWALRRVERWIADSRQEGHVHT